jgi:hypothetical protein
VAARLPLAVGPDGRFDLSSVPSGDSAGLADKRERQLTCEI